MEILEKIDMQVNKQTPKEENELLTLPKGRE